MSWFEATAFASIAKNAIKEAQKKIDEALDIRDEEDKKEEYIIPSQKPNLSKQLKQESENFFANFGVTEKPLDDDDGLKLEKNDDELGGSHNETKEDAGKRGRMVGSLWGSFTGSFFENQKSEEKEIVASKAASAPVTPSEQVVATQPPRSISNLPESSEEPLPVEDSSNSSSIVQLSSDTLSPTTINSTDSPFLEEIKVPPLNVEFSADGVTKDIGWEWGWDSSIMVMSSSAQLKENGEIPLSKSDSFNQEESLADDTVDTDGFAKSRLIVGSVDSESSSNVRESLGSVNSNRSQSEIDSLAPVVEEVFVESTEDIPSLRISLSEDVPKEGLEEDGLPEGTESKDKTGEDSSPSDQVLESPDSIVVLDSNIASPVETSSASEDSKSKSYPQMLQFESALSSPDSIEVISNAETPTSPSSIEVISGTSTEISSPVTQESSSHTLSEEFSETTCSKSSSSSDNKNLPTSKTPGKTWKGISEDPDSQAITKQPISRVVKTIHQEESGKSDTLHSIQGNEIFRLLSEDSKESFHSSTTTSSSTLTVVDVEDESYIHPNDSHVPDFHEGMLSMNAGEIRKNLEGRSDKDIRMELKAISTNSVKCQEDVMDTGVKREEECGSIEASQTTAGLLEMSSRSESSTETVTASMDSQHTVWSDAGMVDSQVDGLKQSYSKSREDEELEVKDMLEDAMDENTQGVIMESNESKSKELQSRDYREQLPEPPTVERELSPSSSDRSDVLKVSSSGQSSGDEVETATSSDIEVISSPSIDGSTNSNSRSSVSQHSSVASKVWLSTQRSLRSFISEKSDAMTTLSPHNAANNNNKKDSNGNGETVPSSMTTSFTSISESEGESPHMPHSELLQLEASRLTHMLLQDLDAREKGHRRNKSNLSETSESSTEPQTTPDIEKLMKKITYLTEVLESRETKVLELSHLNSSLQDANTNMKSRLEELEGLKKGNENTENLREEYTQRMVVMERKFQQALREKENAKKQLEEFKAEVASRRSNADVVREIEEKDTIIAELRREGEKLSKQQLTYSNTIKKLRAKEKENDACIKDQKEKLETLSVDLDRLRKSLKAKDEVERRQIDAVRQLTMSNQRQEEEVKNLRAENSELEGKLSVLKEALDAAYREMNELQRCAASKDAEAQKAALSAEVTAREKVESALADVQKQNKKEQEALMGQIHELQDALSQTESQYNRKEKQLRGEIKDLLDRLSEAESRTDEISNSVSAATRPLLRQMENLQASQLAQQTAWESMEESLTKRLHEAQNASVTSSKKEREIRDQLSSTMTEVSSLQSQLSSYQSENAQLKSKLDVMTVKASALEEAKNRESSQLEALKVSFAEEISEVKHERDILEQQLEIEKTAVVAEKKKSTAYLEQMKEKDRKLAQLQLLTSHPLGGPSGESRLSTPRSSPTPSLSRLSISGSVNDSFAGSHWGDDVFDSAWGGVKGGSLYESLRGNSAATIDALTSTLRQREGEVHHLQSEVTRLEAQKESLAQELVQASRRTDEISVKVQHFEELQEKQKDLEQKYNALLQMYGEKVEEVDELRLDLEDVKEMYKLQIDQLMQK